MTAIVDPVGAVPRAVESRKWFISLAFLAVATAASGAMLASRVDMARVVIPKMQMSGELGKASEREITEEIEQAERIGLVGSVALGVFAMPLACLGFAVLLKVLAWLLGRKAPFGAAFTTACVGLLPVAVFKLIVFVAASRQSLLSPEMAASLVPSSLGDLWQGDFSQPVARALSAVNFFYLWSAVLMGLGFGAATNMKPWRAVLLGLFVYALFAGAVGVGLPGLMPHGGPPGGGRGGMS